jgi:ABC-2 type transport system permease protein
MIFNLILKDFRAYRKYLFLNIFLPGILWTIILSTQFSQWNHYFMFCNMVILAAGSYYTFSEKKQNLQNLVCSLPVTRTQIVISKFLTTSIIILLGMFIFLIATYINGLFLEKVAPLFDKLFHLKIAFMSIYLYSIFFSIFLPATFLFRLSGMVLTIITAVVVSIYSYATFFRPYRSSFTQYFVPDDAWKMLLISLLMIGSLLFSIFLSIKLYSKKNL